MHHWLMVVMLKITLKNYHKKLLPQKITVYCVQPGKLPVNTKLYGKTVVTMNLDSWLIFTSGVTLVQVKRFSPVIATWVMFLLCWKWFSQYLCIHDFVRQGSIHKKEGTNKTKMRAFFFIQSDVSYWKNISILRADILVLRSYKLPNCMGRGYC